MAFCCLGLLVSKGCVSGEYVVNGNKVDSVKIFWHASAIVFQLVVLVVFMLTGLLSSKIFSQDRENGGLVMILARPVHRWQYVLGRLLGTWLFCFVFMFITHSIWSLIVFAEIEAIIPGYFAASVISAINLLFIIVAVGLLTLFLPDFISALIIFVIVLIGFISEGGYQILSSNVVQQLTHSQTVPEVALWRILWPKVMLLQSYAQSMIKDTEFLNMGSLHPGLNLLFYIVLLGGIIIAIFNKKDV